MTPPEWRERDQQQLVPELKTTGSSATVREGVLPQGRQPRARVDRRGEFRRWRVPGRRVRARPDGAQARCGRASRAADGSGARESPGNDGTARRLHRARSQSADRCGTQQCPCGAALSRCETRRTWRKPAEALECVVNDTYRAGDIIGGIRDQVKKVPPRKEERRPERRHRRSDCTRARRAVEESRVDRRRSSRRDCHRFTEIEFNCSR